jgi:opacity protein-like surface antigen
LHLPLSVKCVAALLLRSCQSSLAGEGIWRPGLAAGAGVEWGFASNWTAKAEYLYVAAAGTGVSVDHVNIVRAGINYRFGAF